MKKHIFYIALAVAMFLWGLYNGYNRSNTNASQVHQEENRTSSVEVDSMALERDRKSDQRRDQVKDEMMGLFSEVLSLIKQDIATQKEVALSKEKDYN
jgi:ferric iron reductase protein FhuF|tara:strand:+ start:183 stop:476 length:294 start_codon:yes stop_codon:yes gene_type:complete